MAAKGKKNPNTLTPRLRRQLDQVIASLAHFEVPYIKLILFGSHAKNIAHPDSDIDLCLVFPDAISKFEQYRKQVSIDLNLNRQIPCDLLAYLQGEFEENDLSPILHEVKTWGIVVHSRKQ